MAKEIKTEILINASAKKVWGILTDFKNYPGWNPFIKSIEGTTLAGNKIKAVLEAPGSKPMTFKPKVLVFEKEKEFRWLGHLILPGLFDGEHKFELIDKGNGTILFIQSEKFNGLLIPFFSKMLDNQTKKGFELMNQKLKEMAEN